MIVSGGKAVYGAAIGVLMLDARFPRIPGDMGHAATWPFPVRYRVVRGATPDLAVLRGGSATDGSGLLAPFVAAARELADEGCEGLATNCGFLAPFQRALAEATGLPVIASSLMQVATVERLLPPGRRAGVLTISADSLTRAHLEAACVPQGAPIGGTPPDGAFATAILGDAAQLDVDAARSENVAAALALQAAHPELGALVLECTNMTPYQADIAAATGLPVFSMVDFVCWLQAGLAPRRPPPPQERP